MLQQPPLTAPGVVQCSPGGRGPSNVQSNWRHWSTIPDPGPVLRLWAWNFLRRDSHPESGRTDGDIISGSRRIIEHATGNARNCNLCIIDSPSSANDNSYHSTSIRCGGNHCHRRSAGKLGELVHGCSGSSRTSPTRAYYFLLK